MSESTRRMRRGQCWIVRRKATDFGPYTTDQVLQRIDQREIEMEDEICDASERTWSPLSEFDLFREHFQACQKRWEIRAAEKAAARHEHQLRNARRIKSGAWRIVLIGAFTSLALGGWMTWRLWHVEKTQVFGALARVNLAGLPDPLQPSLEEGVQPTNHVTKVRVLREPWTFDTKGVSTANPNRMRVSTIDFNEDEGQELPEKELQRIITDAQKGLTRCAQKAVKGRREFNGTKVSFTVRSRRLSRFTVGKEVAEHKPFKACVKRVLKNVDVPRFSGAKHSVEIPLVVQR